METKLIKVKCCSKCEKSDTEDKFIKNRNICKMCINKTHRENYKKIIENDIKCDKVCNTCNETKSQDCFIKNGNMCKDCNNKKRRDKYNSDINHRSKLIKMAGDFKHKKVVETQLLKIEKIGKGNKKCSYCNSIKPEHKFRYNRLKCRDCERDDPIEKFNRSIRCRIYISLKNKINHTIKYLGCNYKEYFNWILTDSCTLENRKEWHIDHVIPLSRFNLDNEDEQLIAFNWRNTTAVSVKENLSKNNKIVITQIEQHYKKVLDYHIKNNIKMPQNFIDLFAKHLDAGNSLEL